ncbi:transposable element Tcb2 transposase [Trichonephila clavipes]|nr:transposable element Tcb2 transposase [Trichonephila clavipes]
MAASSSSFIPTPLAHADTLGEGHPRGTPFQFRPTEFNLYNPEKLVTVTGGEDLMCGNIEKLFEVTSACGDGHLIHMVLNDRTASSKQLAARWSAATGVVMSASSIRRYESRFNLWDHDDRIRVRRYAGEHCLPECIIERHSGLTPGVMSAYSPDMSTIEHVWDLVGRRLARDPRPAASKDELLLRIQAIWTDIQNLFHSMPRRIEAVIAACGSYTKY